MAGDISYYATLCAAAAVACISVFRLGPPKATRAWLAAGITASAVGDLTWELYVLVRGAGPDVSVADIAWLASYVCVGVALVRMQRDQGLRLRGDPDALIDMAMVGVIASLVVWLFWVGPTLADTSSPFMVRVVWALYPVLDAALLGLLTRTLVSRSNRGTATRFVAAGLTCWLLSDLGYLALGQETSLAAIMNAGWMLGSILLAAGCWHLRPSEAAKPPESVPAPTTIGAGRVALAVAPLLAPWAIELASYIRGQNLNPLPLIAASTVLAALVYARTLHLLGIGREARAELASSERLYRALAANSSDAVLVLDGNGVMIRDSPGLPALFGTDAVGTVGDDVLALSDGIEGCSGEIRELFDLSLASPGVVFDGEFFLRRIDRPRRWLAARVVNLLADPDVRGIVVNLHDITERKRVEEELAHQAFHDQLTGLANRELFRDRLEHALQQRVRTGLDPAVLYLDLDSFKHVNDSLGHEAGDLLLCEVAERLGLVVRSGDTVARLGGDEFAILIEQSGQAVEDAQLVADRVLEMLAAPIVLAERDIVISASIGIAPAGAESTPSSLLRDADIAMYGAKTSGRARWVEYTPSMRAAAVERLQIENDLNYVLPREQLTVEYQPVVDLTSRRIVGFEALLRWDHPTLGRIPPATFIPVAEDTGTIIPIGRWVLETACRQAADWQARFGGRGAISMAVNVSARQLDSPGLSDDVRRALRASHLDPSSLVLEITETSLIEDAERAMAALTALRRLGVRLAIDDFGTGYSSLSYLQQFPIDILKIDRSFVASIVEEGEIPEIVRGMLDFAQTLHLETVAEGIESTTQLDQLRAHRCDVGQGFLFARPLTAGDAEAMLRESADQAVPLPS